MFKYHILPSKPQVFNLNIVSQWYRIMALHLINIQITEIRIVLKFLYHSTEPEIKLLSRVTKIMNLIEIYFIQHSNNFQYYFINKN